MNLAELIVDMLLTAEAKDFRLKFRTAKKAVQPRAKADLGFSGNNYAGPVSVGSSGGGGDGGGMGA